MRFNRQPKALIFKGGIARTIALVLRAALTARSKIRQPRVRDRRPVAEREKFSSMILPPYVRKTKSLEELIPWLYLKGISTGDFREALAALLGPAASTRPGASVR